MKNASNTRRGRGRNNGKRNQNSRGKNFDVSGNDAKVRGSAQQVLDKYLALARDATSVGDRIAAEGFFQHAEHYYRVLHSEGGKSNNQQDRRRHNKDSNKRISQPLNQSELETSPGEALEEGISMRKQTDASMKKQSSCENTENQDASEKKPRRRARSHQKEESVSTFDDEDAKKSETAA